MIDTLERALRYYIRNQDSFVSRYDGKYIVLVESNGDFEVSGSYEGRQEAISETQRTRPLGTFLVQKVSPGASDYTMSLPARMRLSHR